MFTYFCRLELSLIITLQQILCFVKFYRVDKTITIVQSIKTTNLLPFSVLFKSCVDKTIGTKSLTPYVNRKLRYVGCTCEIFLRLFYVHEKFSIFEYLRLELCKTRSHPLICLRSQV